VTGRTVKHGCGLAGQFVIGAVTGSKEFTKEIVPENEGDPEFETLIVAELSLRISSEVPLNEHSEML
jgi:hypothetical protein